MEFLPLAFPYNSEEKDKNLKYIIPEFSYGVSF